MSLYELLLQLNGSNLSISHLVTYDCFVKGFVLESDRNRKSYQKFYFVDFECVCVFKQISEATWS